MYEWKWSIGEPYYKSSKTNTDATTPKHNANTANTLNTSNNTIFSALSSLSESNTIIQYPNREELDNKIAKRESLPQRGVNPFLQNSYIDDVVNSELFLKPINTTLDNPKLPEHT
jgi:hypothetical protein